MLLVLISFGLVFPVLAQSDEPNIATMNYDETMNDTITSAAIFDWWRVQAIEGDVLVAEMTASVGLEPLLGLLSPGGDLVTRSADGAANGTVTLEYSVPTTGLYTLVTTRVGNAEGTSTGAYTLSVRRDNPVPTRPDNYQDVTFRCRDYEATTVATVQLPEDNRSELSYRMTVYGIDGFQPVIRTGFSAEPDFTDCQARGMGTLDDTFTLPGEAPRTVTAETITQVSQITLNGAEKMGQITLTIASKDGAAGRYVALIEGLRIESGDTDGVQIGIGPLAAQLTDLTVYMVAMPNSRLDPFMSLPDGGATCDDAGLRGCETVPAFNGASFTLHNSGLLTISGDRNDAGLKLNPGNPDPQTVLLGSREGKTYGDYALVLLGTLPPRP